MTARSLLGTVAAVPLLWAWPLAAQRYIADSAANSRIQDMCAGVVTAADLDALLRAESRLSDEASRGRDADLWALSCHRAVLATRSAIGRTGYLMPLGASWREGATNTALVLARTTPAGDAPTLLALVNPDPVLGAEPGQVIAAYRDAVRAGNPDPLVARACTSTGFRMDSSRVVRECSIAALQSGHDSTFHLLALARIAANTADTAATWQHLMAAARSRATPADRDWLDWHLHWMLEPIEFSDWRSRPDSEVYDFVRNAFLGRDIRDGRAPGSRAVEHFQRLAMADSEFRMYPVPLHRKRLLGGAAVTESEEKSGASYLGIDAFTGGSDSPAYFMRDYSRWQTDYDDRGVVWMRFGEPLQRHYFTSHEPRNFIKRETWRYVIDGTQLLLSFENERGDGSEGATRLVSGVIGEHFCGIDNRSCVVGTWSSAAGWFNQVAGRIGRDRVGISVGERMTIRERDRKQIVEATTKDDNSIRFDNELKVLSHPSRVWNPGTGREIALFPWAVEALNLERQSIDGESVAEIDFELRSYAAASGAWWDSTVVKRLRLPGRLSNDAHITGVIVARIPADAISWSLLARQGSDRGGRVFSSNLPPLGDAALILSDLVIGSAVQGVAWNGSVPLAPLGGVDRKEPVSLYFQIRSDTPHHAATTAITVYRVDRNGEEAAIALSFEGDVAAGLTEIRRDLGLERLDKGDYRLEVRVRTAEGREAVRSAALYLR